MANIPDPFMPRIPLSRQVLERYVQDGLGPEERHDVELRAERDPLVREALEGMQQPSAIEGLRGLRPSGSSGLPNWMIYTLGIVVISGSVWLMSEWKTSGRSDASKGLNALDASTPGHAKALASLDSTLLVVHAEIDARPTVMESRGGVSTQVESFQQRAPLSVEREHIERLQVSSPDIVKPIAPRDGPKKDPASRASRRLVFLHGLKVVHPSALYGIAPSDILRSPGTPANTGSSGSNDLPSDLIARPYLDYMDEALGAFMGGDRQRALDDLYILLAQYPVDVNAQFYAGLACYDLGLLPRARRFFDLAEHNRVDAFDEEAAWYLALTIERMDGKAAARSSFEWIAQAKGFYSGPAAERLR